MTTAMQQAFAKAGLDHLVTASEAEIDRLIEGNEIDQDTDGRWIHACRLPTGYLEQLAKIDRLKTQRLTRQARVVAKETMEAEGYETPEDFARAQMRAHLAETSHLQTQAHEAEAVALRSGDDSRYRREPKVFRQHVFNPSDFHDVEAQVDVALFEKDVAHTMHQMIGTSDWDPALEYAQLKEWDALCAMYERLFFNNAEYARSIKKKIALIYRQNDAHDEIPVQEIERLERQLSGLRVQSFNFSRKFKTARRERDLAVGRSGISFGPYRTIAERAKLSAQRYQQTKRARRSELDRLLGMSDAEYRHWLKTDGAYRPRHDGVDSDDGSHNPASMSDTEE